MIDSFVSERDRILTAAIEIISESGLASLNERTISLKDGTSEATIYKCFGGIEEVLVEVVEYFVRFDQSIIRTVRNKDTSNTEKIHFFFETYSTYYDNYPEIAAIVLHYEELLHNIKTRVTISNCIEERYQFLQTLIEDAYQAGELKQVFTASELKCVLMGILQTQILDRRITIHEQTLTQEVMKSVDSILKMITRDDRGI